MDNREIAKEIIVALLNRVAIPGKADDEQYASKWAAKSYKIIHDAVCNPEVDKE